jgi:hypothetical protein
MDYKIIKNSDTKFIEFSSKDYIGLQDLLNTIELYSITLDDMMKKLILVKNQESETEKIGTERVMLEMNENGVIVYDLFEGLVEDEELLPTIRISLDELERVILFYRNEM